MVNLNLQYLAEYILMTTCKLIYIDIIMPFLLNVIPTKK